MRLAKGDNRAEIGELDKRREGLLKERDALSKNINDLNISINEKDKQIKDLNRRIKVIADELGIKLETEDEIILFISQVKSERLNVKELKEVAKRGRTREEKLTREIKQADEKVTELESKITRVFFEKEKVEKDKKELENENKRIREEREEFLNELEKEKKKKGNDDEIKKLKNILINNDKLQDKLIKEKREINDEKEELNRRNNILENEKKQLLEELERKEFERNIAEGFKKEEKKKKVKLDVDIQEGISKPKKKEKVEKKPILIRPRPKEESKLSKEEQLEKLDTEVRKDLVKYVETGNSSNLPNEIKNRLSQRSVKLLGSMNSSTEANISRLNKIERRLIVENLVSKNKIFQNSIKASLEFG